MRISELATKSLTLFTSNKSGVSYVSLSILTTIISFVKGFVVMRYLSLYDLGVITLITTVMGLFTMLQVGFLNGGFRIFSEQHKDSRSVNDIVYSYFFFIQLVVLASITVCYFRGVLSGLEVVYAYAASFFGCLLVLNNWIRNMLIASKRVVEINRLNLSSTIISFLFLFTVPFWGLYGALLVTFSIELLFFIFAIWRTKELLPSRLNYNMKQYRWVLSFGFLPFISGVIVTYNMQIETWSIASFISTEALGEYYLPKLYISLFLLIPNAVSQLFYSDAVKAYTEANYAKVKSVLRNYFIVNTIVGIFLILITILFITPVISFVIPLHVVGIKYIWLILPGLIIYLMRMPLDLVFYASNVLKPFFINSLIGVAVTTIAFLSFGYFGFLTLTYAALIKSTFYVTVSISLLFFYLKKRKLIWHKTIASII